MVSQGEGGASGRGWPTGRREPAASPGSRGGGCGGARRGWQGAAALWPTPPRAAAAAEPRKRAGISCARPARARRAAVSACLSLPQRPPAPTTKRRAEGRGRRHRGGRHRAAGQADGVSGAGPREPRLEGGTPGFPGGEWSRSPVGAGRRVSAASGSLPFPGVGPTDIPRPPLACLPVPVSAVRPCGFPPLSPSARYPLARFSSLAPAPVQGNLFLTSLPLLQPCLSWVL